MRTRIKICGLKTEDDVLAACDAGADAVGFVFHPASPRHVDPDHAWQLCARVSPFVATVGLTVDLSLDDFAAIEERCPTAFSQLHGSEPDDVVAELGPDVIKAITYDPATIGDQLKRYDAMPEVSAILVDGSAGGEGTTFDWSGLAEVTHDIAAPIILAGGLTPENVGQAIRTVRPFAVDVSSGVESSRGVKDHDKIHDFCRAVRAADAQ